STRGRLVLFQVVILAVASAVTAFAIFEYQTVPRRADADNVVYEQWSTIASGLALQDGNIVFTPGRLPESGGDQQVPLETELYTKAGLIGQTSNHVMAGAYLRDLARRALEGGGTGAIQDAAD